MCEGGVWVGIVVCIPCFTSIFSFIYIHEYANEIIVLMTIGLQDLSNCITDDMLVLTCNKDSFGQNSIMFPFL